MRLAREEKELRESRFWLRFLVKTRILDAESLSPLSDECGQLCNIVAKSIVTAKRAIQIAQPAALGAFQPEGLSAESNVKT
jgi:hypothetical protein